MNIMHVVFRFTTHIKSLIVLFTRFQVIDVYSNITSIDGACIQSTALEDQNDYKLIRSKILELHIYMSKSTDRGGV